MSLKLAVLGNPRSGTCLLSYLLATGFDIREKYGSYYPESKSIFMYRVGMELVRMHGDSSYRCLMTIRDPRDVTTSVHPAHATLGTFMRSFRAWVENYKIYKRVLKKGIPVFEYKYEDLVTNPAKVQAEIAEFLDLEIKCPFDQCHLVKDIDYVALDQLTFEMGGVSPLFTTSVGRWKQDKYKERIVTQLAEVPQMADYLIELGYEQDKEWTKDYQLTEWEQDYDKWKNENV